MRALEIALVAIFVLLAWAHAFYLAALEIAALIVRRFKREPGDIARPAPSVTVVLSVYNEEEALPRKLANILDLDYPPEKLDVLVASDGSTDGTQAVVTGTNDPRVRLLAFAQRRGRALVTNDAVAAARGEWLLFTDADTIMRPDFLNALTPHLVNDRVGVVDGRMVCVNDEESTIASDVGFYWKYESALKTAESALGLLASTFGACTAVRRSVFRPLKATEDVDFTTPLDAIKDGYRVVHEPAAEVLEVTHSDLRSQFAARARMVTKNLPGTLRKFDRRLLRRPLVVLAICSHKLLRWATPLLLIVAFVLNVVLVTGGRFLPLLLAQIAFYALAGVGAIGERTDRDIPLASQAFSFVVANAGFLVGVINAARGTQITFYEPHHHASSARE